MSGDEKRRAFSVVTWMTGRFPSLVRDKRGFAMLEVALVVAILFMAGATVINNQIESYRVEAARSVGKNLWKLAEAARWRYVDRGGWPASIDQLVAEGYLPSGWSRRTPFGAQYSAGGHPNEFAVQVTLPSVGLAETAKSVVPLASVVDWSNPPTLVLAVPAPGPKNDDTGNKYLARMGTDAERTMEDDLFLGGHRISGLPNPTRSGDAMTLGAANNRYLPNRNLTWSERFKMQGTLNASVVEASNYADLDGTENASYLNFHEIYERHFGTFGWLSPGKSSYSRWLVVDYNHGGRLWLQSCGKTVLQRAME